MDLLTYAVSQKLRQNNDMWRYTPGKSTVPQDWLVDAFASVIEAYEDEGCTTATSHYDDYLSITFPSPHQTQELGRGGKSMMSPWSAGNSSITKKTEHCGANHPLITNTTALVEVDTADIETLLSELKRSYMKISWTYQLRTASELLDDEPASVVVHEHVRDLPEVEEPKQEPLCASFGWVGSGTWSGITKSFKMSSLFPNQRRCTWTILHGRLTSQGAWTIRYTWKLLLKILN